MDHLKEVLGECINKICQETLMFSSALQYEALLGVTVDNVTTIVFNLKGCAGTKTNDMAAWTRRPITESQVVKSNMEEALSDLCWQKLAEVHTVLIEGTITIILDNAECMLVQLDKVSFVHEKLEEIVDEAKETVEEPKEILEEEPLAVTEDEQEEAVTMTTVVEEITEPAKMDAAVIGTESLNPEEVLVVMVPDNDESMAAQALAEDPSFTQVSSAVTWTTDAAGQLVQTAVQANSETTPMEQDDVYAASLPALTHTNQEAAVLLSQLAMAADMADLVQPKVEAEEPKMKKSPSKNVNVCTVCGIFFPSRYKLNKHCAENHEMQFESMSCGYCNKKFLSLKSMQMHNCRHQCDMCDHVAASKIQLKSHIIREHETPNKSQDEPFSCQICGKRFKTFQRFREHKQFHTVDSLSNMALRKLLDMDGQRLKGACDCVLCDKKFEFSYHLKKHMKKVHVIRGHLDAYNILSQCRQLVLTPVKLRKLLCGSVKSLASLSLSIIARPCTKTGSEYSCCLCDRKRLTQFNVIRHMEQHLRALKEGKSGSLRLAVQRNYPCYECYRKFKSEETLQVHITTEHKNSKKLKEGAKLQCDICGRVFKNATNIHRHMDMHRIRNIGGKAWKTSVPFQCQQCSKCYSTEEKLRTHIKNVHDIDEENVDKLIQVSVETDNSPVVTRTQLKVIENPVVKKEEVNSDEQKKSLDKDEQSATDDSDIIKLKKEDKSDEDIEMQEKPAKKRRQQVICTQCGMTLSGKGALDMHMVRWHKVQPSSKQAEWLQKQQSSDNKSMCELCGKWLQQRSSVRRHMKICQNRKKIS